MHRSKSFALCSFVWIGADRLCAGDPGPTQSVAGDGHLYHSPVPADQPFPSANYGATHGGSNLSLTYPFASPFGFADHSRGQFVYNCSAFFPRNSEGIFGMDVWLEQQDAAGNWNPADLNGGIADGHGDPYQPVNTPNPGPSPSYVFTWTFNPGQLPPNTNFRVFVYVYIYNQGGSNQGEYPIYSTTGTVDTGPANDAPRIAWSPSGGATNPGQIYAGQTYVISADAQDDNGDLIAVSIDKNGQPFAYAGGGDGYAGNSQNPTSDSVGTVTYTVWANDAHGGQSPVISRTVDVIARPILPPVGAFDGVTPGNVPQRQVITGTGWAADAQLGAPVSAVLILIDGGASGSFYASLGGARPDVQAANRTWGQWSPFDITDSAWAFVYNTSGLGQGGHSFTAIAYDFPYGVSAFIGTQSFTVGAPLSQPPYIGAVWADRTALYTGDATVLHVVAADATGNLQAVNLDEIGGPGAVNYFGPGNNFNAASPPDNGWNILGFLTDSYQRDVALTFPVAGRYTFSGAALNNQGQYVNFPNGGGPTADVLVANPPTGSIWADSATLTVGQSTVIHASFSADSPDGDNIGGTNIDRPLGTGLTDGSAQTIRSYTFNPGASGTYTFYARMVTTLSGGWQTFGQVTVSVAAAAQSVALTPATATINAGQQVVFTASGGVNGYVWGGSAGGSGGSNTVTFPDAGTFTVTVYSPAGGNFARSNTASAAITVNSLPAPSTAAVTVKPKGGDVKVQNTVNRHNSQLLVPK
jgi:plastocyanin